LAKLLQQKAWRGDRGRVKKKRGKLFQKVRWPESVPRCRVLGNWGGGGGKTLVRSSPVAARKKNWIRTTTAFALVAGKNRGEKVGRPSAELSKLTPLGIERPITNLFMNMR